MSRTFHSIRRVHSTDGLVHSLTNNWQQGHNATAALNTFSRATLTLSPSHFKPQLDYYHYYYHYYYYCCDTRAPLSLSLACSSSFTFGPLQPFLSPLLFDMFVLRPTSSPSFHSQPAWQQPTYEPFSAFLLPAHSARPQQPSRPSRPTPRSPWCYQLPDSYLPSASYQTNGGVYLDGYYYDEDVNVDGADDSELMEELLLARLQEQRRQEAAEAERLYRARVLRERQLHQMEQQLLAEQQRRVAVRRQQEQARRQQAQRQAEEQQRQRREQEQAEQYAHRLQSALAQLLLGRQLDSDERVDSRKEAGAKLLVRSEEQAEQK
jgi:hypothetical protein